MQWLTLPGHAPATPQRPWPDSDAIAVDHGQLSAWDVARLVWMSSGTAILRQLPTSGFDREASGVRVVVLRPPLCELPLTR